MVIRAFQKVYKKPKYILCALSISVISFVFAVWFPNIGLIMRVVTSVDIPFINKVELPLSLLGSIATNFTVLSASYTIVIAILFGVYISMMTYFLRRRIKEIGQSGVATGFLGVASGLLGVGCAACGSFLLTSLSLFGVSGVLVFLPMGGSEFGIIGMALLAVAIYMVAKKIEDPMVCSM